jgi:hypothetical protein
VVLCKKHLSGSCERQKEPHTTQNMCICELWLKQVVRHVFLQCIMHCGLYIISPAHRLCYLVANRGLCVATVDLRTALVCSGIWAHGQALDALRGCFSRSCLHGPAMVLVHKGCRGVGVTTGCPILPLDLFME